MRKNSFIFTKNKSVTFKIIRNIRDNNNFPYILKFRNSLDEVFFLMHSDFEKQIKNGKIKFSE